MFGKKVKSLDDLINEEEGLNHFTTISDDDYEPSLVKKMRV